MNPHFSVYKLKLIILLKFTIIIFNVSWFPHLAAPIKDVNPILLEN